jgi:putative ABC transport system permease protein
MRRLGDEINERGAPPTVVAMAAVGFVLLLACANVANLLLARAVSRERELAVRAALGAGRGRLVRQLLTESLLLAAAGCGLGLVFAGWALRVLRTSLPELLIATMPNVMELGVDRATLAFSAALAVVCTAFFGAGPAIRMVRTDLQASLKSGGQGTPAPRHQRMRAALMVGEVAISLILLVAAGLLVRTFNGLQHVDTGFNPNRVLTMMTSLPDYRYADAPAQRRFFEAALERIARVPGVTSAAFVNTLPFSTYNDSTRYVVEEGTPPEPGREPATDSRLITADYFKTLEIPVVAGRPFDGRDRDTTARVAIVNRTLARQAFGGSDPIGKRIHLGRRDSGSPWLTIVGVVGDVRHSEVTGPSSPEIYRLLAQDPQAMMMLAVRVSGDEHALTDHVRAAIAAVDPTQPVYHVKTLKRLVGDALLPSAAAMSMMTFFGVLALLLATIGIYGVISYAVSQQTREFGLRLALGASPGDVLQLVFRRALSLVLAGTALGVLGALAVTRLLGGILYGVTPADVTTYLTVASGLILVGGLACFLPALRAMRVDPVVVLRTD